MIVLVSCLSCDEGWDEAAGRAGSSLRDTCGKWDILHRAGLGCMNCLSWEGWE